MVSPEYLKVSIEQKDAILKQPYFLMNLFNVVEAMDKARSRFSEFAPQEGGGIFRIHELYLRDTVGTSSPVFVLAEKPLVLVRTDVADRARAFGFIGLAFKSLPFGPF